MSTFPRTPRQAALAWIRRNGLTAADEQLSVAEILESLRFMTNHLLWLAKQVELTPDVPFKSAPKFQ